MRTPFIISAVVLFVMAFGSQALAQGGAITSAETYLSNQSYEKALEKINKATYHKKTKDDPRTYYVRAKIFTLLYNAMREDEKLVGLVPNPVDSAIVAMKKVVELEQSAGDDKYSKQLKDSKILDTDMTTYGLETNLKNAALMVVQKYQDSEPAKAYEALAPLTGYYNQDTTILLYAGVFAQRSEKLAEAAKYFEMLGDIEGYNKIDGYQYAASTFYQLGDTTNFVRVLEKGQNRFPKETYFILNAADVYSRRQDYPKAIALLEKASELEPNEAKYPTNIAIMYRNMDDIDKTIEYYDKSYQIDNTNYDIAYALGAHYYRQAIEIYNELDAKEQVLTHEKMKPAIELANKGIPYFEQAITLEEGKEDKGVYTALAQLYDFLGKEDKVKEMESKADAIED